MKSDCSMDRHIKFGKDASGKQERVWSPCLSMKSDWSMDRPIMFGKGASGNQERVGSPCLSMKSDWSMDRPIMFGKDASGKQERVGSPCLSMKSDWSMDRPIKFGKDASELTASLLTEDHFRCSVCTEVLKEPVSIPCGHSYCRQCIETHWTQTGDYDCPQCRKRFRTRPDLLTNSALEKVIEKLHQAGFKVPALPKHCYAGPGDVACDLCTEKQLKAVKSCLTCTASYCESHVRHHYTVAALQRHTLVEVTGNLEQKLCQLHHRALEVFCKTDQVSVCLVCALQDHRNHDVIKNERDTEENVKNATIELNNPAKHFCRGLTEDWTADSVVVAALGRPLDLGMLYDSRSDSFCSDVSLWDNSTIASMRQSLPRPLTEVKCIEGDSLQDRFRALDVTTPLRASVLSGLVEVGGAAGYLNHPVQSTLQDRVTLQYRTTTRLDMLSHSVLQEETDRTQLKATHVVMAVLYGAQAFFIFDSKHISGQHSGAGEADMHSVVKKMMPTFSAGQIFSSLSDTEKLNSSLYRCNLYSDVDHVNGSMTYDRALQVYETLPKHLGQQGEKALPLYAWLYPLKNLDNSVEITLRYFTKADHLRQVTMRCQEMTDFTNGCVMKWFPDLKYKLSRLSELLQKYQSEFKRELAMAVKAMRESEGVDENRLRDILQNHDQSPFSPQSIQLWLNNKAAEVKALNVCKTRNIPIMKSQEELGGVLRSSKDRLLCFTLTFLEDEDPFLSTLKHYIHSVQENTMNQSDLTGQQETQRPFKPPDLTQKIQSALRLFIKSYEDSGDGENIKFIAAVIPDISVPGSSIRLYQQGSLITTNFQLGLKPDPFQVAEIKQSCVLLKFPQSTIIRPERYRVEYRVMTTGVSKVSKRPWNVVDTLAPAETCLVPRLKPFALYQIRYSVIEHSVMSDFSKVIEVKTLRSPPVQLFVNRLDKETVKVTWLQPECEDGASVLHYKVDYKETGLEGWSTMVTEGPECKCIITLNLSTCYRVRVSAVYGGGDTSETSRETDVPVNVWSIDLRKRKASLLLEVLNLQPDKKPVELKGCSDEESEVRSFLQCLSYISQLSFTPPQDQRRSPEERRKREKTFLLNLCLQAALHERGTIQTTVKKVLSLSKVYHYQKCDFLLDLYSHVKDYETQTGMSVLPALQPVYQSASPAVWSIDLSKRKASLLLEVLKLQPEKKPVKLKGCSDEESEVRSFLQCLSYISQLSFCPWWYDPSKQIKFLVDLLSQAAEWEEQTGEKTLKLVSSVWTYSTFPFLNGYNSEQSDFLLDLYSHVKDYETQTGRSVLPALQPVYQSAPAVWSIDLSERKASLLLEVLKLQPEKKPVELKGWSDEESEVRSFLQCLSYISQLRFYPWRSDPSKQIKFLVDLLSQAAEWEEQTGEKTLKLVSSVCTYSTFPFPNGDNYRQSDFLLDLYSHVKDYETQTGRSVLPALQPVYQSAPAVWSIDLSERKASLLLEVLKLQPEKKPVELWGWSDEESEVRSFLQCLSYISQLRFPPLMDNIKRRKREKTFLLNLCLQAALHERGTIQTTVEKLSLSKVYHNQKDNFLLDLYSHVKDYETQTGRSVLPALQPVYQSAPAVWSIDLSERKASLLLEVLKLQPEKKPVELKGWSDEESEVRSFLQCLSYISQLSFCPWRSDPSKRIKFLVDLLSQAAVWEEQTREKTLKLVSSVCTYSTFPFLNGDTSKQSDFLLDLYSHVKDYETQTGRSFLPALQPVYQSAPAVWSIDLSERKASLLLEVLKLQPEKKPVELKGWSDEESEVRSFLQCLSYISQLSCGDDSFFQTVCESIPVRSREEDQQLASLLQALGSTLSLGGELPRKTCRSVGRVLGLCASRVDLTLTPSKISLKGAALLLRHESKLHKLRLNLGMAVKLSRLVRRTGRGATPLTVPELSLVLKSSQPPERVLIRALSSVASLLRLWRVQCLDLTDFQIQGHSLITLLCHQGPLSLRLNSDTLQHLTVVVYEAQDKDLTQWFLEKVGGDLTSCRLDWEVLLSLLQHSTHNITVDLRKNRLLEKNISDLLPFLGRVTLKRSSSSFVKSSIRHIYDSRDSDCVSSLLRSSDHWINLNSRELDRVDCTALCFTLQHSHQVKVNLLWTSIPPGEIESILPLLDRVSQLSVDRKLLLSFLQCCAASQVQEGAPSPPIAVWLLRSLHYRLDFSCSSSVDLSAQDQEKALCLTTDHCRAINSVLKQNQHSTQLVQNQVQLILRDCEVEDRALRELLPILHIVKLSPSKALLLQLLDLVCEGIEEGLLRHTESLWRALDGELDFSETRLDQKACGSLALVLEHSEGLSELDLSHCQLTDHHLQPLITHLHKVQVLDLSHNDITDALTDRILQLVSTNTSMHTVRLFNNRIQDRRPFLTDKRFDIW
ncbi:uncharacterized protein [Salvelinus alpinus]|uniref:uncharacterized protein isoform X3 n=1 Tax=Salvelinus alpinus TaxID=8036 RepID=UPI0039FCBA89